MNTTAQEGPRWPGKMTRFAFFAGILAIILFVIAGPGYRLRVLPLLPALLGAAIGFLLFVATFIVGAIGLLAGGRRAFDGRALRSLSWRFLWWWSSLLDSGFFEDAVHRPYMT